MEKKISAKNIFDSVLSSYDEYNPIICQIDNESYYDNNTNLYSITENRNKITKNILYSVFMANNNVLNSSKLETYEYSNFNKNIPDLKPLQYKLERLNSSSSERNGFLESFEDYKDSIINDMLHGYILKEDFSSYLFSFYRGGGVPFVEEKINSVEDIQNKANSILESCKDYITSYNKCISLFESIVDSYGSKFKIALENYVKTYLDYANFAYSIKADAVRQMVTESMNESSEFIWSPLEDDDAKQLNESFFMEDDEFPYLPEYTSEYFTITEAQNIIKLINESVEECMTILEIQSPKDTNNTNTTNNTNNNSTNNTSNNNNSTNTNSQQNNTANNNKQNEKPNINALKRISNIFDKVWQWIKNFFTNTVAKFASDITKRIKNNIPWINSEKNDIINNAKNSQNQIKLPDSDSGVKRMNKALSSEINYPLERFISNYDPNNKEEMLNTFRKEIVSEWEPNAQVDGKNATFSQYCTSFFSGSDNASIKNISSLNIDGIIQFLENESNTKTFTAQINKSYAKAQAEIERARNAVMQKLKITKPVQTNVRVMEKPDNKTITIDANPSPKNNNESSDIISKIINQYGSKTTVRNYENNVLAYNEATPSANTDEFNVSKISAELQYYRLKAQVKTEVATAAMNAYSRMQLRYINILNSLRNKQDNTNQNNQQQGQNNNQQQAQNASAEEIDDDYPYKYFNESIFDKIFKRKPKISTTLPLDKNKVKEYYNIALKAFTKTLNENKDAKPFKNKIDIGLNKIMDNDEYDISEAMDSFIEDGDIEIAAFDMWDIVPNARSEYETKVVKIWDIINKVVSDADNIIQSNPITKDFRLTDEYSDWDDGHIELRLKS